MTIKWKITKFAGNDNTVKNVKYEATNGLKIESGWAFVNVPMPPYGVPLFNEADTSLWINENFDKNTLDKVQNALS